MKKLEQESRERERGGTDEKQEDGINWFAAAEIPERQPDRCVGKTTASTLTGF